MGMNMIVYQIVNEYKKLDEVEAITLAGSGASGRTDLLSDIDIDIIVRKKIDPEKRKNIIKRISDAMEIDNNFWGDGDEFILRNSDIEVDIAYFSYDWLESSLKNVLIDFVASTGYTTCFWHNVRDCVIVYDKSGEFKELKEKYNVEYPKQLKMNILDKNYPILRNAFSSYYNQVEKAIKRGDFVSINHRIAGFLASYFDIIFAINEIPHPGEKRLLDIVDKKCIYKPINFRENVVSLLNNTSTNSNEILDDMNRIVDYLDVLLEKVANN